VSAGAALLLVRLQAELARAVPTGVGSVEERQVERLYGVLAAEAQADAPIPALARVAGMGLTEMTMRSGAAGRDVHSTVAEILALVAAGSRAGPVEAQPTQAQPTAAPVQAEAANEPDDARPGDTGTAGIGVPILPDD
jgi:hypothetical protein